MFSLPVLVALQTNRFQIPVAYAQQLVYEKHPLAMDLLQAIAEQWPVVLNRAPTLHRLSMQAFRVRSKKLSLATTVFNTRSIGRVVLLAYYVATLFDWLRGCVA